MGVIWTSKTRTSQPQGAEPPTDIRGTASTPANKFAIAAANSTAVVARNAGKFGPVQAWATDGAATYLELAQSAGNFGTEGFSVTLVLRSNGSVAIDSAVIGNNQNGVAGGWLLYAGGVSTLRVNTSASFATTLDCGVNIFDGVWHVLTLTRNKAGTYQFIVDGVADASTTVSVFDVDQARTVIAGAQKDTVGAFRHSPFDFALIDLRKRAFSVPEAIQIHRNPWQLFAPEKRPLFFSTGGGANNTGTLAVTLDAATLTGVGGVSTSGTLATTLDAATLAGVGNVTRSGTLAVTLDAATLAGTGAVTTSGTLAVTLDDVTLAGVGSVAVGTNRDGALAVTLDSATLAGVGGVARSGTLAVTLDAATLAGIGTAGQPRTGTLAVTLDNVTLAGIGAIPAAPSAGGGKTFGSNKKKKKQRKAVESEEWLKAEETAKQLLQDRFTKTTPEAKLEALASHIESLQPVIEALKALATEGVQEPVQETRTEELTEHQQVLTKFDALITKMASIEELLIIMMAQ